MTIVVVHDQIFLFFSCDHTLVGFFSVHGKIMVNQAYVCVVKSGCECGYVDMCGSQVVLQI